jgi:FkbM family methyltransferase
MAAGKPRHKQIMITAIKPGNTAYDLGANYGMHALMMALLFGPSGCVYAFEPVPGIFKGSVRKCQDQSS